MIDYRLLNARLLAEIGADVKLSPAELDSLARVAHRERRLLDLEHKNRKDPELMARLTGRNVIQFKRRGA